MPEYNTATNLSHASPTVTITGPGSYSEVFKTKSYPRKDEHPAALVELKDNEGNILAAGTTKELKDRTCILIWEDQSINPPKGVIGNEFDHYKFNDPYTGTQQNIINVDIDYEAGIYPEITIQFIEA